MKRHGIQTSASFFFGRNYICLVTISQDQGEAKFTEPYQKYYRRWCIKLCHSYRHDVSLKNRCHANTEKTANQV